MLTASYGSYGSQWLEAGGVKRWHDGNNVSSVSSSNSEQLEMNETFTSLSHVGAPHDQAGWIPTSVATMTISVWYCWKGESPFVVGETKTLCWSNPYALQWNSTFGSSQSLFWAEPTPFRMKHLHQSWLILDALLGSTVPVISGYIARVIGDISSTMVIPIGKTSTAPPTWRTHSGLTPRKNYPTIWWCISIAP